MPTARLLPLVSSPDPLVAGLLVAISARRVRAHGHRSCLVALPARSPTLLPPLGRQRIAGGRDRQRGHPESQSLQAASGDKQAEVERQRR